MGRGWLVLGGLVLGGCASSPVGEAPRAPVTVLASVPEMPRASSPEIPRAGMPGMPRRGRPTPAGDATGVLAARWSNEASLAIVPPAPLGPRLQKTDSLDLFLAAGFGLVVVGVVGGAIYCGIECHKPLNVVVPISLVVGVPLVLFVTFLVGLSQSGSMGRIIRTSPYSLVSW